MSENLVENSEDMISLITYTPASEGADALGRGLLSDVVSDAISLTGCFGYPTFRFAGAIAFIALWNIKPKLTAPAG